MPSQGATAIPHDAPLASPSRAADSAARLEALLACTPAGLVELDPALRVVAANPRFAAMLGRPLATLHGEPLAGLLPEAMAAPLLAALAALLAGGAPATLLLSDDAGGEPRHWEASAAAIAGADGPEGASLALLDVTGQHAAAFHARRDRRLLKQILAHVPVAVFAKEGPECRYAFISRAAEQLFGWPEGEAVGRTDYDYVAAEQADFFLACDREVLASGRPLVIEEEPLDTAKGRRLLRTVKVPVPAGEHGEQFLLCLSEDITEARRAEAELREALAAAGAAHEARAKFLAAMNHEFRTPIAILIGFAEVLRKRGPEPLSAAELLYLDDMAEAARHLLSLVEEASRHGRPASAEAAEPRQPVTLRALAAGAAALAGADLAAAGVALELDAEGRNAEAVSTLQRAAMQEALAILLREMARRAPQGAVIAVACPAPATLLLTCAALAMARPSIAAFFDTDRPLHRRGLEGLGIALASAAKVLEDNRARLAIESGPRGTTLTLLLATD